MQKNIIGLRKLKIKIIEQSKEKKNRRRKKKTGKLHRTAKPQCRDRGLKLKFFKFLYLTDMSRAIPLHRLLKLNHL